MEGQPRLNCTLKELYAPGINRSYRGTGDLLRSGRVPWTTFGASPARTCSKKVEKTSSASPRRRWSASLHLAGLVVG
jgi:hypothetical protein